MSLLYVFIAFCIACAVAGPVIGILVAGVVAVYLAGQPTDEERELQRRDLVAELNVRHGYHLRDIADLPMDDLRQLQTGGQDER